MSLTVVITGANRGIGLELSRVFASRGDHVIAGCRTPSAASELASSGAEVVAIDTGDPAAIAAFAAVVGGRAVDVLINNAGIDARAVGAPDASRNALELDPDQFDAVMQVNVSGPLRLVQALAPNLRAAKGKVVNISSQVGAFAIAQKMGRDVSYAASKTALTMVSLKQAQAFLADGVTVVAMHPGYVKTDMGGAGAELEPSAAAAEIVATVDRLTIERSGEFIRWNGTVHPW